MILVGVGLFAALGFAMTQGSRGSGANLSKELLELHVTEIVEYSNKLRNALMTMKAIGCEDDEISFERRPFDGSDTDYFNASAPSDFSCHMFHAKGGGMKERTYSEDIYDPAVSVTFQQSFNADNRINNVGSNTAELIYVISGLTDDMCLNINEKLGLGAATITDAAFAASGTTFVGVYGSGDATTQNIAEGTVFEGNTQGCIQETSGCSGVTCNHYVRVLIKK